MPRLLQAMVARCGVLRVVLAGTVLALVGASAWAVQPAASSNDPLVNSSGSWGQDFADQWALTAIGAQSVQRQSNRQVVVAVIDTGIDYQHVDFNASTLWRNPGEEDNGRDDDNNGLVDDLVGWNFVDNTNNPWDDSGHGTHIAGLINACTSNGLGMASISPQATLMPLKVANFAGQARGEAVAAAIDYAVANGASLINLSLGGTLLSEAEQRAAAAAEAAGVLIITAAGNKGLPAENFSYAQLPGALVVGASTVAAQRAGFSNFGASVDLLAPGVDLVSLRATDTDFIALTKPADYTEGAAVVGADEQYYRASGTSFAAAVVTGVAARVLQDRPLLRVSQLANLLQQSARDVEVPGVDQLSGYGQVDIAAALTADPSFYLQTRLTGIELGLRNEALWLAVKGNVGANALASAHLEAAPLGTDKSLAPVGPWQRLSAVVDTNPEAALVAEFEFEMLTQLPAPSADANAAEGAWLLRLIATHSNGRQREARLAIAIPAPIDQQAAAQPPAPNPLLGVNRG